MFLEENFLVKQHFLEQIRDLSPRARARVRARAETHRVFVLDLTTHRLNGQNRDLAKLRGPHSGAESTPKWVIFGSLLWIRGWYINAPDDLRGVVKRVPKMGQKWVFWATFRYPFLEGLVHKCTGWLKGCCKKGPKNVSKVGVLSHF